MQSVANKFGSQMRDIGHQKSCFNTISDNFRNHASEVKQIDPTKLMEDMRKSVVNMLNWKRDAVQRIAEECEKISSHYNYEKEIEYYSYYNMKYIYDDRYGEPPTNSYNWKPLQLSPHPNFEDSLVNLDHSAVHVPINVYEKASDILNDIKWSEDLTEIFKENFANDPSLSWQFFGSARGFIRIYPSTKWKVSHDTHGHSKAPTPDLYDCRVRQWYIQAAASPKDVVILLDTSGSMTGLRRHIALNVVFSILDTLNENDFVIVLMFSNEIKYVSECLTKMVQATKRNIIEIKERLEESIKTADIANFTLSFINSFDILSSLTSERKGAQCNQAIMLITDGAPDTYEAMFKQYNPESLVRVFTYVIGREVTQITEVYWMACNNRGYYAQVANLAEVREQVQNYIPVMSRPLVLSNSRIYEWTPVYTAISEIQLTEWIWGERVKAIKTWLMQHNRGYVLDNMEPVDNINEEKREADNEEESYVENRGDEDVPLNTIDMKMFNIELEMYKRIPDYKKKIPLMITVSAPVFDQRTHINVTRKFLYKNVYKDSEPEPTRIANLLGVAGVDVPIKEIEKMAPKYKVILTFFFSRFYSQVDINEVEMSNNTENPRHVDSILEQIRLDMINGTRGSKRMTVKSTFDSMKRPISRVQHYFYGKVDNTPFGFALVLPEPYGSFRFEAQIDLKNNIRADNYTKYFSGTHWRIHPDWVYCDSPNMISDIVSPTPEEALVQFFNNEMPKNQFIWRTNGINPPRFDNFTCDKELLQSLIFDAIKTHNFEHCSESHKFKRRDDKSIDIVNAFISTRSGLTRFTNPHYSYEFKNRTEYNNLALSIDEVYYRRAVDYFYVDNQAFVYSVPFDNGGNTIVTASQAIFVGNGKMNTPVAVVGIQYNYTSFYSTFFRRARESQLNCDSPEIDCYVLDNNGFIVIAEDLKHSGIFFGEIDDDLLQDLVRTSIYRKMKHFDYQAICIDTIHKSSFSMPLFTPFDNLRRIFGWFISKLTATYLGMFYDSWMANANEMMESSDTTENGDVDYSSESQYPTEPRFNRSRPKQCDKEVELYELNHLANKTLHYIHVCSEQCSRNYYVQRIAHSNLLLLVLDTTACKCSVNTNKFESKPIVYNKDELCQLYQFDSERKRPSSCFNYHPNESEVKLCGGCGQLKPIFLLHIVSLGLLIMKCVGRFF
ncbi:Voltage-dependent calcium channel subunit alpha-2/delta-4 [Blomia tropicalis]|nr:Voltage-dependent calcium channel subunit alpha-2/delta-4 [Blomia tropicalis]